MSAPSADVDESLSVSDPRLDEESEGYEDVEDDTEDIQFIGLFDNQVYSDVHSMLQACKDANSFDLIGALKTLGLDFYGGIKLVNYIRSEVKKGNKTPNVSSRDHFQADEYLQPVLEGDALLFSLDDLLESSADVPPKHISSEKRADDTSTRVQELEIQLRRVQEEYQSYREVVTKTLDERWTAADSGPSSASKPRNKTQDINEEEDKDYFGSYSFTDIHETMIKDTVRTNAYRDFIYQNKDLFAGKTVLDVGCGTGILSLFCARAGASRVIAVDNSRIIEKTRLIVHANNYSSTITCLRGKIEEVTLPVPKVDIIVSEWMGYALLYEAMLDSVLYARDKYLKPSGLLVPSHCTLRIAPVQRDIVALGKTSFWQNVYDFDMTPMTSEIDAPSNSVQTVYHEASELVASSTEFLQLPLHTITVPELEFIKEFSITLNRDVEHLGGWLIWFDTFFLPSRDTVLQDNAEAMSWTKAGNEGVAFTTGPEGTKTHWECAFMSNEKGKRIPLKSGTKITGKVEYKKLHEGSRSLDVGIEWEGEGLERQHNIWRMGMDP